MTEKVWHFGPDKNWHFDYVKEEKYGWTYGPEKEKCSLCSGTGIRLTPHYTAPPCPICGKMMYYGDMADAPVGYYCSDHYYETQSGAWKDVKK